MTEYRLGLLQEFVITTRPAPRRLNFVSVEWPTPNGEPGLAEQFLQEHMVSSTPCLMLIRRGNLESLISGAIPVPRLRQELDDLMTEQMSDRVAAALAEADEATLEDFFGGPMGRTRVSNTCSTCDGGGCPDCTDPA